MTNPKNEIVHMEYQNPHASKPLILPVLVINNTPDRVLHDHIIENSAKDIPWLRAHPSNNIKAIMVGGGASVEDNLDEIKKLVAEGGVVFAMNAASQWLRKQGIPVVYQVIIDAKQESANLVDNEVNFQLIGSQVHPDTLKNATNPSLVHLEIGEIEKLLPPEKVKAGGYALIGGGVSVGNTAMCIAYALGYRNFHVFGYDSCHKDGRSHVYPQDMNNFIPTMKVEWAGKSYQCSVAMKAQAEKFQFTSYQLKELGCNIKVYGEGLLQAMYNAKKEDLTEREKYQMMWEFDMYRWHSPGEDVVDLFLNVVKPEGLIIDFGCGTGRAGVKLTNKGFDVLLTDFTDNCRDEEAQQLPFVRCDLTDILPVGATYGFCTDVLEHIPLKDVDIAIQNIMSAGNQVFFQISTVDDEMGVAIKNRLHLSVHPFEWWKEKFENMGYKIEWSQKENSAALFFVRRVK